MSHYYLTPTALFHIKKVLGDTANKWGMAQARTYAAALEKCFQDIAEKREAIMTGFRADLAKNTGFVLHLVGHHYVAFKVQENDCVIIAAVLHEKMNIPVKLKTLERMSYDEIRALQDQIARQ